MLRRPDTNGPGLDLEREKNETRWIWSNDDGYVSSPMLSGPGHQGSSLSWLASPPDVPLFSRVPEMRAFYLLPQEHCLLS